MPRQNARQSLLDDAVRQHRGGNLSAAMQLYERLLQESPDDAEILDLMSTLLRQRYEYAEAIKLSRRAVFLCPSSSLHLFNLGECCRANGLFDEAIDVYRRALELRPDNASIYTGLGQAYIALARDGEALFVFREAVKLDTQTTRAHEHLAACLMRCGEFDEAEAVTREALEREPRSASHHGRLGSLLARRGELRGAAERFQEVASLRPEWAVPHLELARIFNRMYLPQPAAEAARRAIQFVTTSADAWFELGIAVRRLRQFTAGAAAFTEALRLRPNDVGALTGLAGLEQERLGHSTALQHFRQAAAIAPAPSLVQSRLLMALNYPDGADDLDVFREHERWGRQIAEATTRRAGRMPARADPDRPLRIGYLSADLRKHPVPCFLEPILAGHDPARVTPVVFCDVERPDAVTGRLRNLVGEWHETFGLSSEALVETIRAQRIDILVDLAGHAPRNRLHAFALRAAPVQVSYLGYPNTTGLPHEIMQYRLTDALCDPVGQTDKLHTEQLVRLPGCFLCYRPPKDAPDVAPPPAVKGKGITFGCFNHIVKITRPMIARWSEILHRVPGSRLMIKSKLLADLGTIGVVRDAFAENGIDDGRLILTPYADSYVVHLAKYGEIDIALDTFPYHGTTTTCETLWMGVPVVTWAGASHRSRVGASLLTAVGIEELISDSSDAYINCAVELAKDVDRMSKFRRELRDRMRASCLRNEAGFVRNLEAAYRNMRGTACQNIGACHEPTNNARMPADAGCANLV